MDQLQEGSNPELSFLRLSEVSVLHIQGLMKFTKGLPGKILFHYFLRIYLFLCLCVMHVLIAIIYSYHVHNILWRPEESVWSPRTRVSYRWLWITMWALEPESLQEQDRLLTADLSF